MTIIICKINEDSNNSEIGSIKKPNNKELQALKNLISVLRKVSQDTPAEEIQTKIYTVGKENGYDKNLRDWFKLIYEVLFGEEKITLSLPDRPVILKSNPGSPCRTSDVIFSPHKSVKTKLVFNSIGFSEIGISCPPFSKDISVETPSITNI